MIKRKDREVIREEEIEDSYRRKRGGINRGIKGRRENKRRIINGREMIDISI